MENRTFPGGVHPDDGKAFARDLPFEAYLPGRELAFPLGQHIGRPAKPVVKRGDAVLAGQLLAEADGFVSAHVVSSCSGTVKAIENRPNVTGGLSMAVVVENDGKYTPAEGVGEEADFRALSREAVLAKIRAAGIVGMGGAGFPTHVKLAPRDPAAIRWVLVNGAECEPYITCDDQLMRLYAREIVSGIEILQKLFPNAEAAVVIEKNKPEAIEAMKNACVLKEKMRVYPVETKYPQGGERSVIRVVTGRHLKLGMLPADVGCVVDNVATVRAIYRAVCRNEPLMERGFTVSGDGVTQPRNLIVKLGTPFAEVLEAAGGVASGGAEKMICGGPMMGFAMTDLRAPICKNNNALTVFRQDPVALAEQRQTPCLRCGRCNQACPLGLTPQQMAAAAGRGDYERYEKTLYGLECVACGCCTYICPAKRPLMQLFRQAKAEILQRRQVADK